MTDANRNCLALSSNRKGSTNTVPSSGFIVDSDTGLEDVVHLKREFGHSRMQYVAQTLDIPFMSASVVIHVRRDLSDVTLTNHSRAQSNLG